jgi:hypothetical protein
MSGRYFAPVIAAFTPSLVVGFLVTNWHNIAKIRGSEGTVN